MNENVKIYEKIEPKDNLILQGGNTVKFENYILLNTECSFYDDLYQVYLDSDQLSTKQQDLEDTFLEEMAPVLSILAGDLSGVLSSLSSQQEQLLSSLSAQIESFDLSTQTIGYGREQQSTFNLSSTIHTTDWISVKNGNDIIEINHNLSSIPQKVCMDVKLMKDVGEYETGTVFFDIPTTGFFPGYPAYGLMKFATFEQRVESTSSITRIVFPEYVNNFGTTTHQVNMTRRYGNPITTRVQGHTASLSVPPLMTYGVEGYTGNLIRYYDFQYRFRIYKYA